MSLQTARVLRSLLKFEAFTHRQIAEDSGVNLHTVTTTTQRLGDAIERVSAEAFATVDQRNTHTVTPCGRLIVSPGGLPNDIDLYIAQRALELTKNAVTDNGEILFLAACPNGIGEEKTMENFYGRLTLPLDEVLKSIESEYKLYSHKPYKFAQTIQRLRRIWVRSEIPDEVIRAAHLHPTHDPQGVVDQWLAQDPQAKIIVVEGANKIALYSRPWSCRIARLTYSQNRFPGLTNLAELH